MGVEGYVGEWGSRTLKDHGIKFVVGGGKWGRKRMAEERRW